MEKLLEYLPETASIFASATAFFTTVFAILKFGRGNRISGKYKLDEHFTTSQALLNNGEWKRSHNLTLELWFLGVSGYRLSAEEIRFFLRRRFPLSNLLDYAKYSHEMRIAKDENNEISHIEKKEHKFPFSLSYSTLFHGTIIATSLFSFVLIIMSLIVLYQYTSTEDFKYIIKSTLYEINMLLISLAVLFALSSREMVKISTINRLNCNCQLPELSQSN